MIQQALQQATQKLSAVTDSPALEAELLLAHVLDKPRSHLLAWPEKPLTHVQAEQFAEYLQRRHAGEPVAYIIGRREFWSLDFLVTPDTLIPRPDTEILVTTALELLAHNLPEIKVADLGTGSGAIAAALASERGLWQIYATDISQSALQIASKNAQRFGFHNISFYPGNWCTALPCNDFDMIVSNPPYIAETEWEVYANGLGFEPIGALVAGEDGLDHVRQITAMATEYLKPGGFLLIEHGFLQGAAVRNIFESAGYGMVKSVLDLSKNERVTLGCYLGRSTLSRI